MLVLVDYFWWVKTEKERLKKMFDKLINVTLS